MEHDESDWVTQLRSEFARQLRERHRVEEAHRGLAMLDLVGPLFSHGPDAAAFRELLEQIESYDPEGLPSHEYFNLWAVLVRWGYEHGFLVPLSAPWGLVNTRKLRCIDSGEYPSLKSGEEYRPLDIDHQKQQVRVLDSRGRRNWFPLRLFAAQRRPDRSWGRKGEATCDQRFRR